MKIRSIVLSILLFASLGMAQNNFEFVQFDTTVVADTTGEWGVVILHGEVQNLTSSPITITGIRETQQIPSTWSASFCFGGCLAPFINENTTIIEGDSTEEFTIDVYPNGEIGTAIWLFTMIDSTTMEADSALFTLTYDPTVAVDGARQTMTMSLSAYPNPTNAFVNISVPSVFESGNTFMRVYDVMGREILAKDVSFTQNQTLSLDVSNFMSGIYVVSFQQGAVSAQTRIGVVK